MKRENTQEREETTPGEAFALNKISLRFTNRATEADYLAYMTAKNVIYCRIGWSLILFLALAFLPFDVQIFGENAGQVTLARWIVIGIAALVLSLTWAPRLHRLMPYNPAVFTLVLSAFGIVFLAQSDPATYSPYFTTFFFAFAGIFSIVGMGARNAIVVQVLTFIAVVVIFGIFHPLATNVFVIYSALLPGVILVFGYSGYVIERISREHFAMSAQLRGSLEQVKQLSGLLPICAHCKNIRDDRGYWNRIEDYLDHHSEVSFTHGICPTCAEGVEAEIKKRRPPRSSTPTGPAN